MHDATQMGSPEYSELNEFHAFRFVQARLIGATVLAFGAGPGDEVAPLVTSAMCRCIFVESSGRVLGGPRDTVSRIVYDQGGQGGQN